MIYFRVRTAANLKKSSFEKRAFNDKLIELITATLQKAVTEKYQKYLLQILVCYFIKNIDCRNIQKLGP